MKSQNKFTVISTFSGGGGSSCGYIKAGGKVLLAVEMDKNAIATYQANFPITPIYKGDIHNLTIKKIKEITGINKGELDILDGSPPCQGFSLSGKKNVCDPRNQLYNEYARLLKSLMPKTFVMENVKGLITGKNKIIFKDILTQLKSCGYNVKVRLMNAKWYNVPQSRERVIFIGIRNDLNKEASHPKPQSKPKTVKESLKNIKPDYIKKPSPLSLKFAKLSKPGNRLSKVHPKGHYFNHYLIDVNKPSPTLIKESLGKFIFPGNYRILTPNEAKILSSFPEDFKLTGSEYEQMARVGNAVPPNLIKAVANHIYNNYLK